MPSTALAWMKRWFGPRAAVHTDLTVCGPIGTPLGVCAQRNQVVCECENRPPHRRYILAEHSRFKGAGIVNATEPTDSELPQGVEIISVAPSVRPEATILAISTAIAFVIFLTTDAVHYADSAPYFLYSVALSHFTVNPQAWVRTAGYPLLITATLYPWFRSLMGILAVQAILAALIPWLIYKILLYVSKPLAISGSLLSVVTLLPYQFQNLLYPDEVEVFLSILLCYLMVRYCFASTAKNMVWVFLAYAYDAFLRPPSLLLYLLLLATASMTAWRAREYRRHCIKLFAFMSIGVACLFVGANALDSYLYNQIDQHRPSLVGRSLFYNPFVNSSGVAGAFEDGYYTRMLRAKLVDFFRSAPPDVRDIHTLRPDIAGKFSQYQPDPERMVDTLMKDRTVYTFWALFNTAPYLGRDQGDSLFMKVALEQYWLHPIILWNVITRGLAYYVGIQEQKGPPTFFPFTFQSDSDDFLYGSPTGMTAYAGRVFGQKSITAVRAAFITYSRTIFAPLYRVLLPTGALLTVLGFIVAFYLILRGRSLPELPIFFVVLAVYLFYVGPMIILVGPLFRYVCASALLLMMSGLVSLRMLCDVRNH